MLKAAAKIKIMHLRRSCEVSRAVSIDDDFEAVFLWIRDFAFFMNRNFGCAAEMTR